MLTIVHAVFNDFVLLLVSSVAYILQMFHKKDHQKDNENEEQIVTSNLVAIGQVLAHCTQKANGSVCSDTVAAQALLNLQTSSIRYGALFRLFGMNNKEIHMQQSTLCKSISTLAFLFIRFVLNSYNIIVQPS